MGCDDYGGKTVKTVKDSPPENIYPESENQPVPNI
jgi:hypothetical protein